MICRPISRPAGYFLALLLALGIASCSSDSNTQSGDAGTDAGAGKPFGQTLFAAGNGFLESYDLATGMPRAGVVSSVTSPVDMQALPDGTVMVNLTDRNEVLAIDGKTMLEKTRIASLMGSKRPVHTFITPTYDGKTYWTSMFDGSDATNSSALFIDITPGSATYLKPVGEVKLGIGHHKAAFSATKMRAAMSNIADCDNVVSIYDFTDLSNIKTLATFSARDLGWTGSDPGMGMFDPKFCDQSYMRGKPPSPHGCATSKVSKHIYNSNTGNGDIVDIDVDASPPTFNVLHTHGSGGGHMRAHKDGRYLYAAQEHPREGDVNPPGATCQTGQLVVIDAMAGTISKEIPVLYTGPACTMSIAGGAQKSDGPGDLRVSKDGKWLYLTIDGGFNVMDARTEELAVFDLSDPSNPVQVPSIRHGTSTSHVNLTESGDARSVFIVDNLSGSITQIDAATKMVTRTIRTSMPSAYNPLVVATFGGNEGPSQQVGVIP